MELTLATAGLLPAPLRASPVGRLATERWLAAESDASLSWCGEPRGGRQQYAFWRWLSEGSGTLALPAADQRALSDLLEMQELLPPSERGFAPLPDDAPVRGLRRTAASEEPPPAATAAAATAAASAIALPPEKLARSRTAAWVRRTLSPLGLRFCPYTASAEVSGSGLESFGVRPAPIAYAHSEAGSVASLLVDFWAAACGMAEGGEESVSSIVLSAPSWDDRWGEWHRTVFPLLEASVLAAGLGRTLGAVLRSPPAVVAQAPRSYPRLIEAGIVCFHPQYETPSDAWLARHRFGHMHSPSKLRRYLREHDAALAASTARAASRGGRGRWSSQE
uniref:Uncharacterized protein n=1 Tax=Emiliania huxleyi TaxID=2903 RepID=A0A6V2VCB8_EMIHU